MSPKVKQPDEDFSIDWQGYNTNDPKKREERVDVSPAGTEGIFIDLEPYEVQEIEEVSRMNEGKNSIELTKTIANFIVETKATEIPSNVYAHSKIAFLDWLGCTIAGMNHPLVDKLIRYANVMGGNEHATVLCHNLKKTVTQTAIINGAASHVLDYDDTATVDIRHASVGMFPAFLALAEWKEKSGADFLTAYIIAFKVAALIGACTGMEQYNTGLHTTSTIGHLASAAGCARLLKLSEQQAIYAMGLAGTLSSGLKIVFGTMTKAFHAGNASKAGLEAAIMAKDDFTCAENLLEGPDGYFQVYKGQIKEKELNTLGKTWDLENLAQKYHASCHFTHSAIESFMAIVNEERLSHYDIQSLKIYSSQLALNAAGNTEPKTALEGKFSIPYCVANALLRGDTGLQSFTDEKVNDPNMKIFMKKISLFSDDSLEPMEARVEIETSTGKIYSRSSNIFREIPELEEKKVRTKIKFQNICNPILGNKKTASLTEAVMSLEQVDNMKDFVSVNLS